MCSVKQSQENVLSLGILLYSLKQSLDPEYSPDLEQRKLIHMAEKTLLKNFKIQEPSQYYIFKDGDARLRS
jgi:hypothetical protein